jgi:hypothetical protein
VISLTQALAARRAMLAAAALAATLGAHAAATGDLRLTSLAPLAWGWMLILAALCGPRRAGWRTRGFGRLLAWLAAVQALMHLAMTAAPWAFGIAVHHRTAGVSVAAVLAHLGAAVVLTALLVHLERLLAAALGIAAGIRRLLARPAGRPGPSLPAPAAAPEAPAAAIRRAVCCRGPPAPVAA